MYDIGLTNQITADRTADLSCSLQNLGDDLECLVYMVSFYFELAHSTFQNSLHNVKLRALDAELHMLL